MKTAKLRNLDPEVQKKFPTFRRVDTKWSKGKYYLGAPFALIRGMTAIVSIIMTGISFKLICLGKSYDGNKNPLNGWRATLCKMVIRLASLTIYISHGVIYNYKQIDYDYSEYLGKDYKKTQKTPENPGSIVMQGHASWIDNLIAIRQYGCSFVGKESLKKAPLLGQILNVHGMLFVNRGGTQEERDQQIEQIVDRQRKCETTGRYTALGVFAEGTTTNNQYVLPFKRGAFVGNCSILPGFVHYECPGVSAVHDTKYQLPQMIIAFCSFDINISLTELPLFVPNDYLYQTHKDKGSEKWEIYAWAIRDILAKACGKPMIEVQLKEKFEYESALGYRKTPGDNKKKD
eukprot:403350191